MSQQVIRVRPTKIELIRLRRRLKIARRLHKVLKDRLIILSQELISLIRNSSQLRKEIHDKIMKCEELLVNSYIITEPLTVNTFASARVERLDVVMGTRIVAGVRVPLIEVEAKKGKIDEALYPLSLSKVGECYDDVLKETLRLAEMEASIILIGKEVSRVKRRVNALESILIPRMINTIKYLRMKFEEREREDKIRLKKVKEFLAKKSTGK
jgi:V/A-type H+-transporting ATPase subunit D